MKLCLVCNFQFEDEQELCPKDYSKLVPLGKDQLIGKLIQERYRIDAMIAKGSMGVVYKATQELIGREVAVKVLHGYLVADEESIKRFHKEAKAASRLNHPNITTLYDYGVLGSGQPYIVMDLLRGASLADVLKQRDYLPVDEALVIFKQVCDALAEAHKRGVVHRDIKPENIMLDFTDKGVTIKVVDFGIATFIQEDDTMGKITKTGTVCGSPTYMSPEQCDDNRVDHRSDIYSLGVVFYETITGKVPFSGSDIYGVMTMHVKERPPLLKAVRPDLDFPPYLESVVQKVLSKDPNERFQSAVEFYEALKGKGATAAAPSGGGERPGQQSLSGTRPAMPDSAVSAAAAMAATGGKVATITEAEVKSVVARALQKKMAMEAGQEVDQSPKPSSSSVDPELVRKTVQAATVELQNRRSQSIKSKQNLRRTTGISPGTRLVGFLQQAFPALLTLGLTGCLFFVVANEARMHSLFSNLGLSQHHAAPQPAAAGDIDELIAQHKYEQVRQILEKRQKDGKLSEADVATLDSIYIRNAKKEGKSKHYKQAVAWLEKISGDDKDDDEIRLMLKKYKHMAGMK